MIRLSVMYPVTPVSRFDSKRQSNSRVDGGGLSGED